MMKRKFGGLLLVCVLAGFCCAPARAALLPATTFYVDGSAGADTKGGCFTIGATGTNFVLNAGAYNFTNLASSNGTTNPSIVTSASHNFVAADVGNCLHVTAGTNWTAGFYRIVSVAANAATLDRAVGTAASLTNGTFAVGGALQTITAAVSPAERVASEQIFVKASATYTITANITLNTTAAPSSTVPPNQLVGYTTTPGDGGQASITLSTNTGLTAIDATIGGWYVRNFIINCASLGTSTGVNLGEQTIVMNVKISNCTSQNVLFTSTTQASLIDSEITGCTAACTAAINTSAANSMVLLRNWIHDNVSTGAILPVRSTAIFNLITNNTGATSDGLRFSAGGQDIFNNTIYKSGRDGIRDTGNVLPSSVSIRNNLLVSNVGAGITGGAAAGSAAYPQYDGNAYFGNGSTRANMDDTGAVNAGNAAAPYTNVLDVTLTCSVNPDPFVNSAANNYNLNSEPSCGAGARYSGTPGPFPGNSFSGAIGQGSSQAGASTRSSASAQ